jgi:hypothetical protein
MIIIIVFIYSVLRQVHSLFQSEFSTECDLVLPLSISNVQYAQKKGTPTQISLKPEAATWSTEQMMLEMVHDRVTTGVTRVVWTENAENDWKNDDIITLPG